MNHLYNIIDFGIDYALGCSKEKNVMLVSYLLSKMNLEDLITDSFYEMQYKTEHQKILRLYSRITGRERLRRLERM